MPNTYTQIYLHIVFAIRGRDTMISKIYYESGRASQEKRFQSGVCGNVGKISG